MLSRNFAITSFMLVSHFWPLVSSYNFGTMKTKWLAKDKQLENLPSKMYLSTDPFASYNDLYPQTNQRTTVSSTELQSTVMSDLPVISDTVSANISFEEFIDDSAVEDDSFVQSLDFAKSVVDKTSMLLRGEVIMAIGILSPVLMNVAQTMTSNIMENQMMQENILNAMALYLGNLLFIIFL